MSNTNTGIHNSHSKSDDANFITYCKLHPGVTLGSNICKLKKKILNSVGELFSEFMNAIKKFDHEKILTRFRFKRNENYS